MEFTKIYSGAVSLWTYRIMRWLCSEKTNTSSINRQIGVLLGGSLSKLYAAQCHCTQLWYNHIYWKDITWETKLRSEVSRKYSSNISCFTNQSISSPNIKQSVALFIVRRYRNEWVDKGKVHSMTTSKEIECHTKYNHIVVARQITTQF